MGPLFPNITHGKEEFQEALQIAADKGIVWAVYQTTGFDFSTVQVNFDTGEYGQFGLESLDALKKLTKTLERQTKQIRVRIAQLEVRRCHRLP